MALVVESAPSSAASAASATSSIASRGNDIDFIDDLKNGMAVLLHVKAGKLEPASLRLVETGKLVIKTNREGWRAYCHCYSRNYELGQDELEPIPRRTHTRQLARSVSIVNGGDTHLVKQMLQRSLSLLRRFPQSESIDLTFATAETEERLRVWAHKTLSVKPAATRRQSSAHVMNALAGRTLSDSSDHPTAVADNSPQPEKQQQQQQQQPQEERDLPPVLPRSASVHPAQQQTRLERRHSLNPFTQKSQRMTHRRGGGSDGGMETSGVGSGSGGGGGVRRTKSRDFDDDGSTENTSWAWKEPPVLRKMETSRTAGRSRSRPRRASATSAAPAATYPTEETPKMGRVASMDNAMNRRERQPPADVDFWDPLGLMSNLTPQTPKTARSVTGSHRSGEWDTPRSSPRGTPRGTPKSTPGSTPLGSPAEPRGRKKPRVPRTE